MRGDARRRASRTRAPVLHVQLAAPLEVCAVALTALRVNCDRAFGGRKGASCGPAGKAESFHPRRLSHACPGRAAASEVLYSSAHMRFLVPASRADASWDSLSLSRSYSDLRAELAMQPSRPVSTTPGVLSTVCRVRTQVSMILDGSGCGLQIRR